ncbi:MAG TPA: insecticidal delta-endotoxin Cry8Ea1 family protein [Nitrospira sp.]|nr:insecticidal delta-endotoxin Cry8Ea1 family protein [Nitrospira sp.]
MGLNQSPSKAQVEQLIDQKLEKQTYEAAILKLQALNSNMHDYLLAVQTNQSNPTNGVITSTWETTDGLFDNDVVVFQADPYRALLSPLFAQFANLHLTLLRDGVLHGKSWGWTDEYVAAVDFQFKDGTSTGWIGKPEGGGPPQTLSFPGRVLSSIWIADRTSAFTGVGMVFGFQYEQTLQPLTETIRKFYIESPLDISLDDLAAQLASTHASFEQLSAMASAEGWNAQRQAYWATLKVRQ